MEDTQQQGPAEPKSRPGEYCKVKTGEVTLCIHSHDWVSIEFLIFLLQAMMDDKSEPLNYYAAYSEVKKLVIYRVTSKYVESFSVIPEGRGSGLSK